MANADPLTLGVLAALEARDPDSGYARLDLEGYSDNEIEFTVRLLHIERLIEAARVPVSEGSADRGTGRWEPSGLTEAGRKFLKDVRQA